MTSPLDNVNYHKPKNAIALFLELAFLSLQELLVHVQIDIQVHSIQLAWLPVFVRLRLLQNLDQPFRIHRV